MAMSVIETPPPPVMPPATELRPLREFFPGRCDKTIWEYRARGYGGDPKKKLNTYKAGNRYYTTAADVQDFLRRINGSA
jgi:hypothetical protein